ncbi:MAG: ABC transporter permease subunit [Deltaproteobacteria bacterium]|jgi:ABC-2 type transport system permease protein
MNTKHILAVMRREWLELVRTRTLLLTLAFVPFALVCISIGVEWSLSRLPDAVFDLGAGEVMVPALLVRYGDLGVRYSVYALLNEQSLALLLVVATALPSSVASHAIVGEKVERTLEPLLATPIATRDLLLAKCLIAILPSLVLTWLSYFASLAGIACFAPASVLAVAMRLEWWLAYFLLAPLLAMASSLAAAIASSRVSDPRTAQGLTSFLLIPLVGTGISAMMGFLSIDLRWVAVASAGLFGLDVALLWIATRLFDRETILTRWR